MMTRRFALLAFSSVGISLGVTGCFPVVATGMVVGAFSISDRRTAGAQAEDQSIELKAFNRVRDQYKGDKAIAVSVTSYNRIALITGHVPSPTVKNDVAGIISRIENVRLVINELQIGPPQGASGYGADTFLTSRVKVALLDDKAINAHFVKVVTEASVVYLMGLVTEREANRAAEITSRVPSVRRVVKAFEIISEAQAKALEAAAQSGAALPETQGQSPQGAAAPAKSAPSSPAPAGVQVSPVR